MESAAGHYSGMPMSVRKATLRCSPTRSSQSRVRRHTLADLCTTLCACCLRALSWRAQQTPTASRPCAFATQDGWLAAEAHFVWGSVMYGYLLYDTAFTLAFYSAVRSPSAPPAYANAPLSHKKPATRSVGLQVPAAPWPGPLVRCLSAWRFCPA